MSPLLSGAAEDGSQFTTATQITPDNVSQLQRTWTFKTGDLSDGFTHYKGHSFQAVPVYWQGKLYISTSSNLVFAIDAASGKEIWRFDPEILKDVGYSENASRGVSLWHGDSDVCPDRVFHGTLNGELFALNAETGEKCNGFGIDGRVDLGEGIRNRRPGDYSVTSPVAVLDDRIIVGSAVGDNGAVELEQGIVRALDPVSGDLLWQWDPIPRSGDDSASETWQAGSNLSTGAANAWAPLSVDPERALVFIPTSSPSPDFYGGKRLGQNLYANSLVAINTDTGEVAWFQQLVHHDLWDYDIPSEPTLTTITRNDESIPVVISTTKTGMMFVFHRETGEPVFPVEERPVPGSDAEGEQSHPTQPFSAISLSRTSPITQDDAFGILWFDKLDCEEQIGKYRSEGIFTPPSEQGTIISPGWAGGTNWGGVAVDTNRQIAVVNLMSLVGVVRLLPRENYESIVRDRSMPDWQLTAMRGTPYGMARRFILSDIGIPCVKPPWGELAAIDLTTGTTLWRQPFGTIQDLAPFPLPAFVANWFSDWGAPTIGGPLMTASGLIFIGASADYNFRAYDSTTGKELWKHRLPTIAASIPMSFEQDGKQYIAVAVGGHSGFGSRRGDELMVFSLPD